MKFKCNKDGVYAVGESYLVEWFGVTKDRMELAEFQLWDKVKDDDKDEDYSITLYVNGGFYHLSYHLLAEIFIQQPEVIACQGGGEHTESGLHHNPGYVEDGTSAEYSLAEANCPDWCIGIIPSIDTNLPWDFELCDNCIKYGRRRYGI